MLSPEVLASHQATLELLRKVRYDFIYSFCYSSRPHTTAARLDDALSLGEKRERLYEVQALQRAITPERLVEMQRQLAHARETYFENPMRTAVSLVWFRLQALRAASGGQNRTNTR